MRLVQACTIAGSDSGGGAGIQADIKTFQERQVFGTSVIVALTVQNTLGVTGVYPTPLQAVAEQLEAVFSDFDLGAVKTGMLVDDSYMTLVAEFLKEYPSIPLVVDPVMIAKGGASLMAAQAMKAMATTLVQLATLITPNLPEAEELVGRPIVTEAEMVSAACEIQGMGSRNVLIKGGHGLNQAEARDYLLTNDGIGHWLSGPRYDTKHTHGTGCTYSACITAELAKGKSVVEAVRIGKAFIDAAIKEELKIGHGQGPTNHWAYGRKERGDDRND